MLLICENHSALKRCSAENAASMLATTLAYLPKIPSLLLTMSLIDRAGRSKLLRCFVPLMGLSHLSLVWAFSASE